MKKTVYDNLITALESGNYKRELRYALRKEGRYSLLGVLCDLYSKETGVKWVEDSEKPGLYSILGEYDELPEEIQEWAGVTTPDPVMNYKYPDFTFNEMNVTTINHDVVEHPWRIIVILLKDIRHDTIT